ncbi:MAG TPA: radical SAM family heme chaperone HemW [Solirubrobacteraceae bacterium]|nr:radical SAM family heme chaperone HemW [Solirubrobacteraceae bacterium]
MSPPLGIYVHVPFCAARCGYCDFNTYVPDGPDQPAQFVEAALAELRLAATELGGRRAETVFFGGGTPTLLGADGLVRLLDGVASIVGLALGAEVTTEANPESVDPASFRALAAGGFTRVSLGMQSSAPHVLRALDRVHTPGRAVAAAVEAREAGFDHVSLDLIYGTDGESDADWERTLTDALSAEPDHISAYALTIEPGTALAAAIRRGAVRAPDDGDQARRYVAADERFAAAGLEWYELSNWAADADGRCHHNLGYWRSHDWWGVGPGAHSHVDGVRWWNVKRPADYAARLSRGESPGAGREVLSARQRALEAVMLGLRMRDGLAVDALGSAGESALDEQVACGRVVVEDDRIVLTRDGRLFADAVIRALSG